MGPNSLQVFDQIAVFKWLRRHFDMLAQCPAVVTNDRHRMCPLTEQSSAMHIQIVFRNYK